MRRCVRGLCMFRGERKEAGAGDRRRCRWQLPSLRMLSSAPRCRAVAFNPPFTESGVKSGAPQVSSQQDCRVCRRCQVICGQWSPCAHKARACLTSCLASVGWGSTVSRAKRSLSRGSSRDPPRSEHATLRTTRLLDTYRPIATPLFHSAIPQSCRSLLSPRTS